jgi:ABC-type Fe3+ transport system permease subunit
MLRNNYLFKRNSTVPEASEEPTSQYKSRLNPDLPNLAGLPGLDELHASLVKRPRGFFTWALIFPLVLAFTSGVLVQYFASGVLVQFAVDKIVGINSGLEISSKTVLLSLATLCLGFGLATLLHWRIRDAQWRKLDEQYEALETRADTLVKAAAHLGRRTSARSP